MSINAPKDLHQPGITPTPKAEKEKAAVTLKGNNRTGLLGSVAIAQVIEGTTSATRIIGETVKHSLGTMPENFVNYARERIAPLVETAQG